MKRLPLLSAMVLLASGPAAWRRCPQKIRLVRSQYGTKQRIPQSAPAKDKARDKAKDKANPKPKDKAKDEPKEQSAQDHRSVPSGTGGVERTGPHPGSPQGQDGDRGWHTSPQIPLAIGGRGN